MVYLETSAATGQNIGQAVDILLDKIMRRMEATMETSLLPHQRVLRCHEQDSPSSNTPCHC